MTGVQADKIGVILLVERHAGDDANPKTQPHIRLDHIGISGGKHHFRGQPVGLEGLVQLRTAGKAKHVGDQRKFGKIRQRQFGFLRQRVIFRHNDAAVPFVARHHDQVVEQLHGLGGNGKIHRAIGGHF